jgi:hypothetical protein
VPSQIQIYNGYNAENLEMPSSALLISNKNTIFHLTIDKLKEETAYEVYMIGASIHPGYPDLMQEGDIVFIEIDTAEDPSRKIFWGLKQIRPEKQAKWMVGSYRRGDGFPGCSFNITLTIKNFLGNAKSKVRIIY